VSTQAAELPVWRALLSYVRPFRWALVVGAGLSLATGATGLALPLVVRELITGLRSDRAVTSLLVIMSLLALANAMIGAVGSFLLERTAESVVLLARRQLVSRLLWLRIPAVDATEPGDLMSRVTADDEDLPSRSRKVKHDEIAGAKQAIQDAAPDAKARFYRAPAGRSSTAGDPDSVQQLAADLGMQPLAWSIDTEDWTKPGAHDIVSSIESAGSDDVILLHDAGGDRAQTLAALRIALPWLVEHGYQFDLPA
jgi:ABC transporter transmembrane protein